MEPVFRLLGEGRLTAPEVDALARTLEASGLPEVPAARLALARQIPDVLGRHHAGAAGLTLPGLAGLSGAPGPRRLVAALIVDQHPWMAAVGMRGGARGISRQVFEIDEYEVVVQGKSRQREPGHEVTGQILRDGDPVGSVAVLLAGAAQRAETEAEEDGSFRFAGGIVEGSYELDVWADTDLIVCLPVVLGARLPTP